MKFVAAGINDTKNQADSHAEQHAQWKCKQHQHRTKAEHTINSHMRHFSKTQLQNRILVCGQGYHQIPACKSMHHLAEQQCYLIADLMRFHSRLCGKMKNHRHPENRQSNCKHSQYFHNFYLISFPSVPQLPYLISLCSATTLLLILFYNYKIFFRFSGENIIIL